MPDKDNTLDAVEGARAAARIPGALRGQIWIAPDFDTLPQDLLAAMESDEPCNKP